jgi:hypothetical protein
MSTLEIERDLDDEVLATEAVEITDCGRASEKTRGTPFLLLLELGIPPNDTIFLF